MCDGVIGSTEQGIVCGLSEDNDMFPIAVVIEISRLLTALGVDGDRDSSNERSFIVVDKEKLLKDADAVLELAHSATERVWVSWLPLVLPTSRLSGQSARVEGKGVLPVR